MLAAVLFVLGGGILINTLSSPEVPPQNVDEVVDVITDEYKEIMAREGFVSYKLND